MSALKKSEIIHATEGNNAENTESQEEPRPHHQPAETINFEAGMKSTPTKVGII